MPGTLYIVGTPIGNMEDITLRALRVLREADIIAAEDTRRTGQLLARHGIPTHSHSLAHSSVVRGSPDPAQASTEGLPDSTGTGDLSVPRRGAVGEPKRSGDAAVVCGKPAPNNANAETSSAPRLAHRGREAAPTAVPLHPSSLIPHPSSSRSPRLISYHQFNEAKRTQELLKELQQGHTVALVTDAGMPTISDPGQRLIQAVLEWNEWCSCASMKRRSSEYEHPALHRSAATTTESAEGGQAVDTGTENRELKTENCIPLEIIPGPSAVTMAMVAACSHGALPPCRRPVVRRSPDRALSSTEGLPGTAGSGDLSVRRHGAVGSPAPNKKGPARRSLGAGRFLFYGFLPHKSAQRRKALSRLSALPFALVFFESPYRLVKSLRDMLEVLGNRQVVVARELTKKFEEIIRGDLASILKKLENRSIKGEITVVVEGCEE